MKKNNEFLYFVIGFLSIFALFALLESIFATKDKSRVVRIKRSINTPNEVDAEGFNNDMNAIAKDMNFALDNLKKKYELHAI